MRIITVLLLFSCTTACGGPEPLLEQIKRQGEFVVATRNSSTTYYEGPHGLAGLEYELVRLFGDYLGAKPRFIIPQSFDEILPMVARGEVHFAAAGLTVTRSREAWIRFGPGYQKITQQVVCKAGNRKPRSVADLIGVQVEIIADSSHEETLTQLSGDYPGLQWETHREVESEELMFLVKEGLIDCTIADSNEVALNRRYYPSLAIGFDLTQPQKLAWASARSHDDSLHNAMLSFFAEISDSGQLAQLLERYYGHVKRLNFVDSQTFRVHVAQRLPQYISLFEEAAALTGLDWQLLAAMGYQESHWSPKAVSPTGVRGIMMLTRATAKQIGVTDRSDPGQSILGGARYLNMIDAKLPRRIAHPDRLWLALAGYNVGFGHLEDARILTQRQGGDPDKWADVKLSLPLLSQKKWHQTTRYGYARGREPVNYVDNVRNYYDMLHWINNGRQQAKDNKAVPYASKIEPKVL